MSSLSYAGMDQVNMDLLAGLQVWQMLAETAQSMSLYMSWPLQLSYRLAGILQQCTKLTNKPVSLVWSGLAVVPMAAAGSLLACIQGHCETDQLLQQ